MTKHPTSYPTSFPTTGYSEEANEIVVYISLGFLFFFMVCCIIFSLPKQKEKAPIPIPNEQKPLISPMTSNPNPNPNYSTHKPLPDFDHSGSDDESEVYLESVDRKDSFTQVQEYWGKAKFDQRIQEKNNSTLSELVVHSPPPPPPAINKTPPPSRTPSPVPSFSPVPPTLPPPPMTTPLASPPPAPSPLPPLHPVALKSSLLSTLRGPGLLVTLYRSPSFASSESSSLSSSSHHSPPSPSSTSSSPSLPSCKQIRLSLSPDGLSLLWQSTHHPPNLSYPSSSFPHSPPLPSPHPSSPSSSSHHHPHQQISKFSSLVSFLPKRKGKLHSLSLLDITEMYRGKATYTFSLFPPSSPSPSTTTSHPQPPFEECCLSVLSSVQGVCLDLEAPGEREREALFIGLSLIIQEAKSKQQRK